MSGATSNELVLHAPAKLNLFLKVLGKREDGFHEIDTIMQQIDLHDTLRFRLRNDGQIRLQIRYTNRSQAAADPLPTDESNLVVKAARLLQQLGEVPFGADIELWKRIPSQAGLGGGSADAGATLRGLNRLWNAGLDQHTLIELAAQLGSDIPFFAAGHSLARCQGRGEIMTPARSRPISFVIVKPQTGLSTAAVYSGCSSSSFPQSGKDVINALHEPNPAGLKYCVRNGLEQPARQLNATVERLLTLMEQQPFLSTMLCGSGSACFGICHSRKQSLQLARRLQGLTAEDVFVARSRV
ncbi:MAG: 4-(cytidine 5'-diphospho)-2-C-methyl-D-erythritol kinase [Rubinisphaera brasiliensis]|uniref:4-(cytidine 5'-diphospho)-2-C-methyl-D-erythritol kinase n=1 Tax=Rubinisphaera brasiliensis TaxID=119 RepID=UPI00391BD350